MIARPNDRRIVAHHIGGRGGQRSFPFLQRFEKDLVNVLYEADRDCIEHIRRSGQSFESELHVVTECVGGTDDTGTLHVNYDPFTNSLLEFNPDYGAFYYHSSDHDYVFAEAAREVEKRNVEICPLDRLLDKYSPAVPMPNFLSVDTQGSEYQILLGAKGALSSHVVAVAVEVEFHRIYKEQKLFGDILELMDESGFHFVKFIAPRQPVSPYRAPIGLRGDGFHLYDEALFLRKVPALEALEADAGTRNLLLKKLAFVSIVYKQIEYALQCLEAARKFAGDSGNGDKDEPAYLSFLGDLEIEINKVPREWPRSFASKFTLADSKARFGGGRQKIATVLKISATKQAYATYSGVETLLMSHGFDALAKLMRDNRILQKAIHDYLTENPDFDRENRLAAIRFEVD